MIDSGTASAGMIVARALCKNRKITAITSATAQQLAAHTNITWQGPCQRADVLTGQLDPRELCEIHLDAIARIDPQLHAFLDVRPALVRDGVLVRRGVAAVAVGEV